MTRPQLFLILGTVVLLIVIAAAGYGGYWYYQADQAVRSQFASTTQAFRQAQDALALEQAKNAQLLATLTDAQAKNGNFESQIGEIANTVGTLTKIAHTDPQLLAKYSKVYFLNENYIPAKLSDIPSAQTYDAKRQYQFETDALPFLEALLSDANDVKLNSPLEVVSAYRSYGEQSSLKASYKVTYGSGSANAFSADQGYSEHQLGTALDFTTAKLGANFASGFDTTDAYAWLTTNAYKYGFILSYPKGNGYYVYEPWHWRFVGVKLATYLHDQGQYFYNLDQRTINSYLPNLFDPS